MTFIAPGSPTAAQGTWPGPGPNTVPASPGFFMPCTAPPGFQNSAAAAAGTGYNTLFRSMGVGYISSIALQVASGSGNYAVGIYQGGSGNPNTPQYLQSLTRVASSGSIPCVTGLPQIPISPSPVFVNLNSYFALWTDNTIATFMSCGNGWGGGIPPVNSWVAGLCLMDSTTGTPIPANLNITGGGRGVIILMTGC